LVRRRGRVTRSPTAEQPEQLDDRLRAIERRREPGHHVAVLPHVAVLYYPTVLGDEVIVA
jgi:hypothetical protein